MTTKFLATAALAASIALAPGVAQSAPSDCFHHSELCVEPQDHNLDGSFVTRKPPSLGEKLRQTLAQALVDIWNGPSW